MNRKFTFKTRKPTGRWKSFFNPNHVIKLGGLEVGSIDSEYPYYIRFMVIKKDIMEDNNPNCEWMWKKLAHKSVSLDYAKQFCTDNAEIILNQFTLYNEKQV